MNGITNQISTAIQNAASGLREAKLPLAAGLLETWGWGVSYVASLLTFALQFETDHPIAFWGRLTLCAIAAARWMLAALTINLRRQIAQLQRTR